MSKNNIKTSGFSLAKRKELTGDDFYEVKQLDDMTIAVVCDGVGSAQEGALAAKKVTLHLINNFKNLPKAWSIEKAIKEFNETLKNSPQLLNDELYLFKNIYNIRLKLKQLPSQHLDNILLITEYFKAPRENMNFKYIKPEILNNPLFLSYAMI